MKEALKQAKKAALIDEVPIGCVIVHDDKIIAEVIINEISFTALWVMRRFPQSKKQVRLWETGGLRSARCM